MSGIADQLVTLIRLQECDSRIRRMGMKIVEGPSMIEALRQGLDSVEARLEEDLKFLDTCKRQRRERESQIDDIEVDIQKSNQKLQNIKSNKEYNAALKEIDDFRGEQSRLEEDVLDLMEQIEALEQKCILTKKEKSSEEQGYNERKEAAMEELKGLKNDLGVLEKERDGLRSEVDADLLARYDILVDRKGGVAIGSVNKGVCQACNMGIPPQKFNELIRGDKLMMCPHCRRIIYWGEDERLQ